MSAPIPLPALWRATGDDVQRLIDSFSRSLDRRGEPRAPIPFRFRLTPCGPAAGAPPGAVAADSPVFGKDLTTRSVCFYHQTPLPYRRAVLTLDEPGQETFALVVELVRCRFSSPGRYETVARIIAPPAAATPAA